MVKRLAFLQFSLWTQAQFLGENPFVTRWTCRAGEELSVPLVGNYNYTWALASSTELPAVQVASVAEGAMLRLRATSAGEYLLKAGSDGVRYIRFLGQGANDGQKLGSHLSLIRVEKWGAVAWESMRGAFYYCENMELAPDAGVPNLTGVTDMYEAFFACRKFNTSINDWDVSRVTDMAALFWGCIAFDQPLGNWQTANVKTMRYLFANCHSFNQDISGWEVGNVTEMRNMFAGCHQINQPLTAWQVQKVQTVESMFEGCYAFNQDLSGWDLSSARWMDRMFAECRAFNSPLGSWKVQNAFRMREMFLNCHTFNQDLSGWNVSNVTDMEEMFTNCHAFDQSLAGWIPQAAP